MKILILSCNDLQNSNRDPKTTTQYNNKLKTIFHIRAAPLNLS